MPHPVRSDVAVGPGWIPESARPHHIQLRVRIGVRRGFPDVAARVVDYFAHLQGELSLLTVIFGGGSRCPAVYGQR